MENPYLLENVTRLRITLTCGNEEAWKLIGTPKGLSRWFPRDCRGRIAPGESLEFIWGEDDSDRFEILNVDEGTAWEMEWEAGGRGRVLYTIESEDPVIFTLGVKYADTEEGRRWQLIELAPWSFYLTNLKSVSGGGKDLRGLPTRYSWRDAFIDV